MGHGAVEFVGVTPVTDYLVLCGVMAAAFGLGFVTALLLVIARDGDRDEAELDTEEARRAALGSRMGHPPREQDQESEWTYKEQDNGNS